MSEPAQEEQNAASAERIEDIEDPAAVETEPSDTTAADEGEAADPLEAALAEAAKWKDLAARSQAELDNYRKRMAREKADAIKFSNAGLLAELLPIIDNFQMGLDAAKAEGEDSTIARGMEMVQKQLVEFFASQGAQEIAAAGEPFDPNQHDAISQQHSAEVPDGHVITEVRRGYKLHDRLLRAANVVVSKGPEEAGDGS